jgi:hypothetical protein
MKKSKALLLVSLLIYFPLFVIVAGNLIPPLDSNILSFLWSAVIGFFYLSLVCFTFSMVLKVLPHRLDFSFTTLFVFLYMVFWELLIFTVLYQAPDMEAMFVNLHTMQIFTLSKILLGAGILTLTLMFFLISEKKSLIHVSAGLLLVSLLLPLAKERAYKQQVNRFFGNYKVGNIHFVVDHDFLSSGHRESIVFEVADRKFKGDFKKAENYSSSNLSPDGRYSIGYDDQKSKFLVIDQKTKQPIFVLRHWASNIQWSPDSRFIVYDYAYDRDDLSKIFVVNIDAKKTILLAAGGCPVWTQ